MPRESAISVKIFNQTYHLATSQERDAEYIQRAAAYLDEKMLEASENAGHRAPLDVAILAALNIAEEALAAREKKEGLLDDTDARIHSFTQKLNEEHAPPEEDPPPPRF
jgi:cell division protein ZapA (FtsZ GTPase activity inhibitor)